MKVLLVSNQYAENNIGNPIISRMKDAIGSDSRVSKIDFFPFKNRVPILRKIRAVARNYDIIHIHFGGLYALLIWCAVANLKVRKFITFHGTDIHAKALSSTKSFLGKLKIIFNQKASFLLIKLFDKVGFVAAPLIEYIPSKIYNSCKNKFFIQQLGVDYDKFSLIDKASAQAYLGLSPAKYVLFSDVSHTNIKRRDLAEDIVKCLGPDFKLLPMSGVEADIVPYYINSSEFAILTSDEEGSPNIIREVLALNKPFFSVNVGDAAKQLEGLQNSTVISRNPEEAASQIKSVINKPYVDFTRENKRRKLDFGILSKEVINLYERSLISDENS